MPSNALLNPGTDPYSVSLRTWFTGNANGRNIVQKGQSGTPGGYWKIEIHKSRFSCLFRGAAGSVSVSLPAVYKQWHDVTCSRTDAGVSLTVDGKTVIEEGAQVVASASPGERAIGHVSSSYWSANVGAPIALALVKGGRARTSGRVNVSLPTGAVAMDVVDPVFVDPEGTRLDG